MADSRCGLKCSEMKEDCKSYGFDCPGCSNLTAPIWGGECAVKTCCEGKKLEHCGECADFPCQTLVDYSHDAEHGDNGARIENCKKWCK